MNIKQIQQMMKQAQKMQGSMETIQKEIDKKEFVATAGGGVVTVKMMGDKKIQEINIKEDILDPEEREMLQDMIKIAVNQALEDIDTYTKEQMGPITQGLPF
ncbi:MAG: YbaB/EbfC family nucleoid-associated protein [Mycoplasmatales bacterium]